MKENKKSRNWFNIEYRHIQNKKLVVTVSVQLLYVVDLVGGDDECRVVRQVLRHYLTKRGFRGNVEAVGRLVHQQPLCACGKGDTHKYLFLLTHRELAQVADVGQFEGREAVVEHLLVEAGVEGTDERDVFLKRHLGQRKLFRHEEDAAEHQRIALGRFHAVNIKMALLRAE